MRIIFDAQALQMYSLFKDGFRGGTETYVLEVAEGLAAKGHEVHVVANDCDRDQQRKGVWFWPPAYHPTAADAVVAVHSLEYVTPEAGYDAPVLVAMGNGLGAFLGPDDEWAKFVDAWPVFSKCHADLLTKHHKNVDPAKCHVTGLGIDLGEFDYFYDNPGGQWRNPSANEAKVPGRIFVSNDPARGLWHVLDVFDAVKKRIPETILHVGYDWETAFEQRKWASNALAETLWDCKRRLETTEGVKLLGKLSREDLIREQLECQVHIWPSDPPNVGSQIHGLTQMECAAAGAALVLSDVEAFPEVFGEAATILPVPGTFLPPEGEEEGHRVNAEDWAEVVAELMTDPEKWTEASRKSRALAEQHDWGRVVNAWDSMLNGLKGAA